MEATTALTVRPPSDGAQALIFDGRMIGVITHPRKSRNWFLHIAPQQTDQGLRQGSPPIKFHRQSLALAHAKDCISERTGRLITLYHDSEER